MSRTAKRRPAVLPCRFVLSRCPTGISYQAIDRMSPKGVAVLSQAIRVRVVLKYLGQLSVSLIGMAVVPLLVALWFGDSLFAWHSAVPLAVLLIVGLPLSRLSAPSPIQPNEGLVVVALTFVLAALAMTWPFAATGLPILDAVFEATSAVTTTGLSTLGSAANLSPTHLLSRAWLQWYGGLVIVVLALGLVLAPRTATKRLASGETEEGDMVAGTRVRARRALLVYAALTLAGLALLLVAGVAPFAAAVHTLAGISTGGFSNFDAGLAALGPWPVQALTLCLPLLGAISFSLYYRAWYGEPGALFGDREVMSLVLLCLIMSAVMALIMALVGGRSWADALVQGPLIAVSAQTTVGFTPLAPGELDAGSKLTLIVAMLIGGDAGSTAGGIKILRFLIVVRLLHILLLRSALPPHAVMPFRVAGRTLEPPEVQVAVSIVLLFLVALLVSWLPFLLLGYAPLDSLFDVASALGTVGLSAGITGPTLHPLLKAVLCIDMLMGRLEIIAVLVLFYPQTWFGRRRETQ